MLSSGANHKCNEKETLLFHPWQASSCGRQNQLQISQSYYSLIFFGRFYDLVLLLNSVYDKCLPNL